jgi:hypothetical protein
LREFSEFGTPAFDSNTVLPMRALARVGQQFFLQFILVIMAEAKDAENQRRKKEDQKG